MFPLESVLKFFTLKSTQRAYHNFYLKQPQFFILYPELVRIKPNSVENMN